MTGQISVSYTHLVIVTWAEDIPEISIIKTSEKEKAAVNKDALNEAIKKPIDDKWTADSKRAAEEAKAAAEEIAANEYVTQEVVDLAEKAQMCIRDRSYRLE